jgi:hypothetical protein
MGRVSALLAMIAALGPAGSATAAELQSAVPARFQGEWAGSIAGCATTTDELRLSIGASTIRYFESSGTIKAAVTQGEHELALISELSGEGETWLDVSHFQLSDDGKTLADETTDAEVVRYRCPKRA